MLNKSDLAIIIPAFNEAASLGDVVDRATVFGTVIVVDDASHDGTAQIAEGRGAIVVSHARNLGYDRALDSGFKKAGVLGCAFAVTLDADGQHDPATLEAFISQLAKADLVLGVRPRKQRAAEILFAGLTRILYGIRDPLCGMKGYRMSLHQALGHFDSYGSIGTELALYSVRRGTRFVEVPVPIRAREGAPRFDTRWRANLRILRAMLIMFRKHFGLFAGES